MEVYDPFVINRHHIRPINTKLVFIKNNLCVLKLYFSATPSSNTMVAVSTKDLRWQFSGNEIKPNLLQFEESKSYFLSLFVRTRSFSVCWFGLSPRSTQHSGSSLNFGVLSRKEVTHCNQESFLDRNIFLGHLLLLSYVTLIYYFICYTAKSVQIIQYNFSQIIMLKQLLIK